MRYSILGFNQSKVIETNLDLTDLVILQYIQQACGSTKMKHIVTDNEQALVWISHAKFHEDLPILNMSEGTFKNRLTTLKKEGFILSETHTNTNVKGSCTYYGITEKTEELLYSSNSTTSNASLENDVEDTTTSRKNDVIDAPRHAKMTSYNQLNKDNKLNTLSKDNVSFQFGKAKTSSNDDCTAKKKLSLWDKCISKIDEFTDDAVLHEMLVSSLKLFSENSRESNTPFYSNNFVGKLNTLKKLSTDNYVQRDIVKQTLDNGWNNFYEIKQKQNYTSKRRVNNFATDVEFLNSRAEVADKENMTIYDTF